jgi:hypothetical protein
LDLTKEKLTKTRGNAIVSLATASRAQTRLAISERDRGIPVALNYAKSIKMRARPAIFAIRNWEISHIASSSVV